MSLIVWARAYPKTQCRCLCAGPSRCTPAQPLSWACTRRAASPTSWTLCSRAPPRRLLARPSHAACQARGTPVEVCMADCTLHGRPAGFCHDSAESSPFVGPTRLTCSWPCPRTSCACHARGLRPAPPCAGVPRLAAAHAAHPALARGGLGCVEGLRLLLRLACCHAPAAAWAHHVCPQHCIARPNTWPSI